MPILATPTTDSHPTDEQEPAGAARLSLKPAAPVSGSVDGAWWPRSTDLTDELPALLAALGERWGRVERVSYHLTSWTGPAVPRRIRSGDTLVRLSGYRTMHPATIDVLGARAQLTLLVVPPGTAEDAARTALEAAASPGGAGSVDELLPAG